MRDREGRGQWKKYKEFDDRYRVRQGSEARSLQKTKSVQDKMKTYTLHLLIKYCLSTQPSRGKEVENAFFTVEARRFMHLVLDKDRLEMYVPWTIMSKRLPNQI
jgi:hypothetical protein